MIKNLAIQVFVFFIIFQGLSLMRESSMLGFGDSVETQVLETTNNEKITLFNHDKSTVIYFFAPWCQICHASISNLETLHKNNPHINIVAVGLDYVDKQQILDFISMHKLSIPVVYGTEQIKQEYKVIGYPSYYVVNEENSVVAKSMGYSTEIGLKLRSF